MAPLAEFVRDFMAGPPPGAARGSGASNVSMLLNPGSSLASGSANVEQMRRITTAWACIRLYSQMGGTLPTKVVRRGDRSRTEIRNDATRIFWDRPNPAMVSPTAWSQQLLSTLTRGNPFMWKGRADGTYKPERPYEGITELWPLHPKDVRIIKGPDSEKLFVIAGDIDERGEQVVRTTDEIAHTPYLSQDGYVGMSPLEDNAASLGIAIAAQRQEGRQITDGLRTPGVLTSSEMIEQDEAEQIVDRWMQNKTGQNQRPIVLGKGASFTPITLSPQDAQLLETLGYFAQDIPLQIYGVPPHMVSIVSKSTSWGTGIEQMFIGFLVTGMLPLIIPFEQLYSSECLDPELEMKFSVNGLLRGDMNARSNFYRTLRNIGAMSADTILELEDLPPRGIPDDYLSPQNMTRLVVEPGMGGVAPEDDAVSYAHGSMPVISEARCACGALLGRNVTSGELWCAKCKAKRQFGPLASTAMVLAEAEGSAPRDRQDFWDGVGAQIAERIIS